MNIKFRQRSDYTFKYNEQLGRHGWLRLTPAYSVKLVTEIMDSVPKNSFILDPFSGTATSGLVAAEKLLENSLKNLGFSNIGSKAIRKRNSKKELFEYCVYATWKGSTQCEPPYFRRTLDRQLMLF